MERGLIIDIIEALDFLKMYFGEEHINQYHDVATTMKPLVQEDLSQLTVVSLGTLLELYSHDTEFAKMLVQVTLQRLEDQNQQSKGG